MRKRKVQDFVIPRFVRIAVRNKFRATVLPIFRKQLPWTGVSTVHINSLERHFISQHGEDGIVSSIASHGMFQSGSFLEIGFYPAEANLIHYSICHKSYGVFVDADERVCSLARKTFACMNLQNVTVINQKVCPDRVNALISEHCGNSLGVMSIDIDSVDYWLWKEVTAVKPDLVILEYNGALGPDKALTVPRDWEDITCEEDKLGIFLGASLKALVELSKSKGYRFIGCESSGINAFFLAESVLEDDFSEVTVEDAFIWPYHLMERGIEPSQCREIIAKLPFLEV